jgi:ATPase subunit of ABC transporter with duplicated ATPase domains
VLAGVLEPDSGSVRLGANVTLGYYAQEHEDLDFEQAAFAHVRNLAGPDVSDAELRGVLGQFGISGEMAWQATGTFSGGERTKLALARLVVGKANVLLLDEPTNNLDPQSRAAVIDALNQFEGTVIVVSHDAGFVAELDCDRAVVLPAGVVLPYDDDLLELVTVR